MSLTPAGFSIAGNAYANRGYDGTNGATVNLVLEQSPALDVQSLAFTQVSKTPGAPDLTGLPVTISNPTSPNTPVPVTLAGSGAHSWIVQSQINGGKDTTGKTYAPYTATRCISIRGPNGKRKICPGEVFEYDPVNGWIGSYDADNVDASLGAPFKLLVPLLAGRQNTFLATADEVGAAAFDPTKFMQPTVSLPRTIKFVCVLETDALGVTASLELHDITGGTSIVTINPGGAMNVPAIYRSADLAGTLAQAEHLYGARLTRIGGSSSDYVTCKYAAFELQYG